MLPQLLIGATEDDTRQIEGRIQGHRDALGTGVERQPGGGEGCGLSMEN